MADLDIQKSQHLLKHLEGEMMFLSVLMSQIESLSSQAQFFSTGIKKTWFDINRGYKNCGQCVEEQR